MKEVYLYGASGHALVVGEIIGKIHDVRYVDDRKVGVFFNEQEVLSPSVISEKSDVIIAIGDNFTRKKVSDKLSCSFLTAIANSALLSSSVKIGNGTVVMQGAIIQAMSSIGEHCIINTGASVDHECEISDYVHISPHATLCGNVKIGEGTWIGAGAVVIQGVKVGKWSVVAAGSVVTKDIPDFSLAAGNRCRVVKRLMTEDV